MEVAHSWPSRLLTAVAVQVYKSKFHGLLGASPYTSLDHLSEEGREAPLRRFTWTKNLQWKVGGDLEPCDDHVSVNNKGCAKHEEWKVRVK